MLSDFPDLTFYVRIVEWKGYRYIQHRLLVRCTLTPLRKYWILFKVKKLREMCFTYHKLLRFFLSCIDSCVKTCCSECSGRIYSSYYQQWAKCVAMGGTWKSSHDFSEFMQLFSLNYTATGRSVHNRHVTMRQQLADVVQMWRKIPESYLNGIPVINNIEHTWSKLLRNGIRKPLFILSQLVVLSSDGCEASNQYSTETGQKANNVSQWENVIGQAVTYDLVLP